MEASEVCTVSLIVAIADNGVIGREGGLPWRLASDLKRFRRLTMGHPLVMGRKTFQSIGKPLDGRDSIVVTKELPASARPEDERVFFAASLEEAISIAKRRAQARAVNEIFVIGGAAVFSQALPLARRIYLTRVHGSPEGDARWDPPLGAEWIEISREDRAAGVTDDYPVTDIVLERGLAPVDCA
jgi:dihydrofolate reductase